MEDPKAPDPNEPDGPSKLDDPDGEPVAAGLADVEEEGFRTFSGLANTLFTALCAIIAVFAIWANIDGTVSTILLVGIHFAGFAFLCSVRFPTRFGSWTAPLYFDVIIGLIVAGSTLYIVGSENAIYARGVTMSWSEWIAALIVIVGSIEMTRRATGLVIPIIIIVALAYVLFLGTLIPGVFRFAGLSVEAVVFRSIFTDEGMFGTIGRISATFVFMFIIFGAFLVRSGAGEFIIDLARVVAGRLIGGPGFVAVISSGLTGTISGSAVANTVSTGVITIPLMKKSGFPPRFAAGVEAASSTGGQLMPPIMGAGAFVMASNTQIPYLDIVAVATLPAIVYFLSVAFFVRIEAKKHGIIGVEADGRTVWQVLREGGPAFLIPITVLIGLLIYGFTPVYAAGWAILAVIVASWMTPRKMGPKAIYEALALGSLNMIMTAVLLIAVGLIVNVIATTGLGNTFSLMIANWAGGNLLIAILLIALASLVLGMGLPVTAAYIVLATLSASALTALIQNSYLVEALTAGTLAMDSKALFMAVNPAALEILAQPMSAEAAKALIAETPRDILLLVYPTVLDAATMTGALLSAHMIIFWLSQDSNVTPPVCLTAFAAAAIAKTPPMSTGFVAWKLAKGLYLMPILFAYTPFLSGSADQVLLIFVKAVLGVYALGAALEGHMETPLNWPLRLLAGAGGLALIWPDQPYVAIAGAIVVLVLIVWSVRGDRAAQRLEVKANEGNF